MVATITIDSLDIRRLLAAEISRQSGQKIDPDQIVLSDESVTADWPMVIELDASK